MPIRLMYPWTEFMKPSRRNMPPSFEIRYRPQNREGGKAWVETVLENPGYFFVLTRIAGRDERPPGLWYFRYRGFLRVLVSAWLPWQALSRVKVVNPSPMWDWGPSPLLLEKLGNLY